MSERVIRALFVACAVSITWGIRGDFGGYLGAMSPGAALGLAFAFITGRRAMFQWMPVLGAVSGLVIAFGGEMSYGVLHGYAKADTLINYSYGYFTLFCQGASWGIFGCAAMGLLLERQALRVWEWASAFAAVYLGGFLLHWLVVDVSGFDVNPPRSNISVAHFGGAMALFTWLTVNKRRVGLRGALFGFFGFGIAMFSGRLIEMASFQVPIPTSYWNLNEVMVGFFGAFSFTYGMLGYDYPDPPQEEPKTFSFVSLASILFVMVGIPFRHRLRKLNTEIRLEEWTRAFTGYGYETPDEMAQFILTLLNLVCVFAVIGAGLWIVIQQKQLWRFRAFPIFYFILLMIMYQKFHSHYFWYPRNGWTPNMHDAYWLMFAVMAVTAYLSREPSTVRTDTELNKLPWVRWIVSTVVIYVLVLAAAGLWVNKDGKNMNSANTRFPVWYWGDGPFPRQD